MYVNGKKRGPGRPRKPPEESIGAELVVCVDGICESGEAAVRKIAELFAACSKAAGCKDMQIIVRNNHPP